MNKGMESEEPIYVIHFTLDDFYIIIYQLIMYCAKPYFPCVLLFFCLPFRS